MSTFGKAYENTRFRPHESRNYVWEKISGFFLSRSPGFRPTVVADLGCGYGSWIKSLSAPRRIAIDMNPNLPATLKANAVEGVEAHIGSITQLEFLGSKSVDLLLMSNILEHLTHLEIQSALEEAHRVLKSGGQIWVVQPNFAHCYKTYFDDYTHRSIFTHVSLQDLFESHGFKTKKIWPRFLPLTLKSRMSTFSFLVPIYLRSPIKPLSGQMAAIFERS